MRQKLSQVLLGIYDIILSIGAIYMGIMMSLGNGMFAEYPKEWLSKVPFENWVAPGLIAIVVFGLGNIIAAISSFNKESSKSWILSAVMGLIFFISMIFQVILLEEWYMATLEFFIFSIIQLCLSGYVFLRYRKS
jgi:NADH:ubiquinone oxidoreductase subunit 6 (subunit J)